MKDKFKIDEETIQVDIDDGVINKHIQEAARLYQRREALLVANALLCGYDGVDIKHKNGGEWLGYPEQRLEVEVWSGRAPRTEWYPRGHARYDFRKMSRSNKDRLLSLIGASVDDIPEEND